MSRNTSRIILDGDLNRLLKLSKKIVEKHISDGASSILPDDLVDAIQEALTAADGFQNEQVELYRKTEIDMEARNLALGLDRNQSSFTPNTVRFDLCAIRDFLKGQFLGSEKSLGNWGFTVNQPRKKNVIPMPRKAPEIIDLAKNIIAKHVADGPASILPSTMMDPFIILTNRANDMHNSSDKSRKSAENATENRNNITGLGTGNARKNPNALINLVRSVKYFLLAHFRGQTQALGDWGFEVNRSTRKPATPKKKAENQDKPTEVAE